MLTSSGLGITRYFLPIWAHLRHGTGIYESQPLPQNHRATWRYVNFQYMSIWDMIQSWISMTVLRFHGISFSIHFLRGYMKSGKKEWQIYLYGCFQEMIVRWCQMHDRFPYLFSSGENLEDGSGMVTYPHKRDTSDRGFRHATQNWSRLHWLHQLWTCFFLITPNKTEMFSEIAWNIVKLRKLGTQDIDVDHPFWRVVWALSIPWVKT